MKKIITLAILAIYLNGFTALAATDDKWLSDKARLEKLSSDKAEMSDEERCQAIWDILWPWAIKDNLEARSYLFFLMAPPPHMKPLLLPGNTGDSVTKFKDAIIMAVHSYPYQFDTDMKETYQNVAHTLYQQAGFEQSSSGRKFLKCLENSENNCAEIAVQERLVPSFEEYAKNIDVFISAGIKSHCAE